MVVLRSMFALMICRLVIGEVLTVRFCSDVLFVVC